MTKPNIEIKFFHDPLLQEEERLRAIAKCLVKEFLTSQGQEEFIEKEKPISPTEELLGNVEKHRSTESKEVLL